MSSLSTLPKGDSAWLLRKAIERIIQQVSVLETNIGSSTTGNSANTQIIFNDNGTLRGDTGLVYNKATDLLSFGAGLCYGLLTSASATITGDLTVDTSTLKVDSANNRVGIGIASPIDVFQVFSNNPSVYITDNSIAGSDQANLYFGPNTVPTYAGILVDIANDIFNIRHNSSTRLSIGSTGIFTWQNVGGVAGTAMTLNSTGLGVGVTPSASGGCLQLKSGITFPATQVASSDANTLDDYEEGTFTATLKGGIADPTTPVTTTARYTKVGRQVSVQIWFNNVNTTGASGSISVTGLPFAPAASIYTAGSAAVGDMATFAGTLGAWITPSPVQIDLLSSNSGGSITGATHNAGTSRYLAINITYTV